MRMLDNVIDINYYAVKKARDSNLRHRPVGLGLMGVPGQPVRVAHALRQPMPLLSLPTSPMEAICYYAYWASTELASERGRYSSYKGSLWDQGILPTRHAGHAGRAARRLRRSRPLQHAGLGCAAAKASPADGMRNSNCVAIAPTATISNIIGVDASIEPCFGNLSVKSNLSGEFTVINELPGA